MELHGSRIKLRPICNDDYPRIVSWGKNEEVEYFSGGSYPTTLDECRAWMATALSSRNRVRFGIALGSRLIGDIELDHIAWRRGDAELRVRIGEKDLWDLGYGTDAVVTLLDYAFGVMNLNCVYLKVYADNHRAIRCYHKAGFKKEGKLALSRLNQREIYLMRVLKKEFLRRQFRLAANS
ncbi:MAG: GNAT family N-acetyltransferase [Limnochordia bacterium]|jgi:RimJ/RimL family protein N-acetyltransferase|nr:GNAT family N-acetyltransferase [Bacillota bacterium]HOB07963.1 GNAT family N-acetyltransferase [Limnochordia bacterium]NLH31569.1 GNAT family N-acetyltransferase [Bacillota bacterium]HPT92129.1 GNAT family N-acetyltransferase [Limnochordia bacterium]HPZ29884.1 GNAT family N-acetyltransferase [Limnochordia bacterium]